MKSDSRKLREAIAQAMVNVWLADGTTYDLKRQSSRLLESDVTLQTLCTIFNIAWIPERKFKAFAHTHFKRFSDSMWEAKSSVRQLNFARKACGLNIQHGTGGAVTVGSKKNDKRHDWATVK